MNRSSALRTLAFFAGLAAIGWAGAGYLGSNLLALSVTLVIAAFYLIGALELRKYQQATATLQQALASNDAMPQPASGGLAPWLERLHPSLRQAVRQRIEGERVGLPGPALTPYITGLLVLLGMLGTFLGMVVTLHGTGTALESATDLSAVRASLAAPVKGLGLAFGTSLAGIAGSAMLGLLSALCRRERLQAAQQLDARIGSSLRVFSLAHQREESLRLLSQQSQLMPAVVDRLEAMMAALAQQNQAMNERLLAGQEAFHQKAGAAYSELAASVGRSLNESLADSARAAGAVIEPVVERTMAGIASTFENGSVSLVRSVSAQLQTAVGDVTSQLGTTLGSVTGQLESTLGGVSNKLDTTLDAVSLRLDATLNGVSGQLASTLGAVSGQLESTLGGVSSQLESTLGSVSTQLESTLGNVSDKLDATLGNVSGKLDATVESVSGKLDATLGSVSEKLESTVGGVSAQLESTLGAVSSKLDTTLADVSTQLDGNLGGVSAQLESTLARMSAQLEGTLGGVSAKLETTLDGVSAQLRGSADEVAAQWRGALAEHQQAGAALAAGTQQALQAAAGSFEAHSASLLQALDQSNVRQQDALAARDEQRLAAWTESLQTLAAGLQQQWHEAGAQNLAQQQEICRTLAQTADAMAAQSQEHARGTIAEIGQLVQAASEAPRAAAEVMAELRQKLSDSMARDNSLLEERAGILQTLETLLGAINHAATEQRAAIDALVAGSAEMLQRVGNEFGQKAQAQAQEINDAAAQLTGSAVDVASLGDALGGAVELFGQANDKMVSQLQRIEAALAKAMARSDEQLDYYVAQAREVVDLSVRSQKQIIEELQQFAANSPPALAAANEA